MNIIKLNAIDSTNDYLKRLSSTHVLENFTVVTAENQTNGKGQMGAKWNSENGKNLIVSILIKNILKQTSDIFNLNVAITTAIATTLIDIDIPHISIKWPNDILSDSKKIAGILIENTLKTDGSIISIIGFGININQTSFENLPQASSLCNITHQIYDKDLILSNIIDNIQFNISLLSKRMNVILWEKYHGLLFKKNIFMPFKDSNHQTFMGKIVGVTAHGKLEIVLENKIIKSFDLKEITMLY
ncbi:biotin--[acetyl-CoA-carboxylase] ligase [Flavobacterium branchiophilum NBRC 15030 = ATCC 35035]|uniref:BirA family biotin operon repressor/biotin-[acetyl-CoA-carboxylase] ligase n=1 Tax=Flavobacterium branchiophilum TaxID=55197 RepID=A0A543G7L2_9FLAO|nr:biotin--[acetyl-CoA-carboxylase] ligase [Flavobacterium branchiophilum]OXA70890.1 biotin--[acetyl-CoA-carboxylase] ligase [Flavobacterium branchiophilum NBRC 15030 = ATCC 35035]TQM42075.1 BirA family biotin operon repressor/biotin-[acetyl-CoA-carboxylase] ligase [Flavobacterium branchiophilum]GEM53846.1 biotin--[acetyl-CoA-carboxylase] ligase [Flavobacterium branchiophilum NBRC 15030 = ATCC 35035]